jgi:hypothetical protein
MDQTSMYQHPAFAEPEPPSDLVALAAQRGWPDELLGRAVRLRVDRGAVTTWLQDGWPPPEWLARFLDGLERLTSGTMRLREATWADHDLLTDLFAHAPEEVGDWLVTVERGPNPYAQFRLQEHPNVQVLEDRRVGLGAAAHSTRNTLIGGQETSVHFMSAWRVREGFRGQGFARLLQMNSAGPGVAWFGLVTYWYVRTGNAARSWIERVKDDFQDRPSGWNVKPQGLTATVHYLRGLAAGSPSRRVRPATVADLDRCVELINHTHGGLDLFRPCTVEFLRQRLDDPSWGPKPPFWAHVYDWSDFAVVEDAGRIVACGGLWDRGEHLRERWYQPASGDSYMIDATALMDFGFEDGGSAAIVELIGHFVARTAELGRTVMMVPLEHLPAVLDGCADFDPTPETRALEVVPFTSPALTVDATISRPHTDLAYW